MKKLNTTKEEFMKSDSLKGEYGNLKYVSESGKIFKTDKGRILKFVTEAREYINDDSIEPETSDEFIIFDDPTIFNQIAQIQKKEEKKIEDEVKSGEVTPQDIAQAADKAASKNAMATVATGVASSAINSATQLATSKAALGIAAAVGYKKVIDKAADVGEQAGGKIGDTYSDIAGYNDNMDAGIEANAEYVKMQKQMGQKLADYSKISNLGQGNSSKEALQMDKRAMYIAQSLKNGEDIQGSKGIITRDQALQELKDKGYEINKDGVVNRASNWVDPKAATTAAAGAAASGVAGGGWSLFGLSAASIGWIVGGVAAAAIITPYIYDKVRACTKTWMADIIAEVKFKADGKNYRCFYDLKENKWVLTYADIKWTSYLDNKLDKETIDEFFASKFFQNFLNKCRQTFAMLFSTSKNEVVFKTLPKIKDAPKELKKILEKIYDNKGAITKNLFVGKHD